MALYPGSGRCPSGLAQRLVNIPPELHSPLSPCDSPLPCLHPPAQSQPGTPPHTPSSSAEDTHTQMSSPQRLGQREACRGTLLAHGPTRQAGSGTPFLQKLRNQKWEGPAGWASLGDRPEEEVGPHNKKDPRGHRNSTPVSESSQGCLKTWVGSPALPRTA